MTKPKYLHPRSKLVAARQDSPSLKTTVPEKIVNEMRLQAGDSLEWIWISEGLITYCKIIKAAK